MRETPLIRATKLLLTIQYRYNYSYNLVIRDLESGRLPIITETAIMSYLNVNTISEAVKYLVLASESVVFYSKYKSIDLIKKGWIAKRLPSDISDIFKRISEGKPVYLIRKKNK